MAGGLTGPSSSPDPRRWSRSPRSWPRSSTPRTPTCTISVDGPGTGDGFALFCKGETDISDASRPIEDAEAKACKKAGIELRRAEDRPRRHHGDDEPGERRRDLPEQAATSTRCSARSPRASRTGRTRTRWTRRSAGTGTFPDVPLDITAPGEESGTYDAFIELVADRGHRAVAGRRRGQGGALRPDYQSSPNDNVIIQGDRGLRLLARMGRVRVRAERRRQVKELQVDGGDGCVAPTATRSPTAATRCPARCTST